MTIFSHTLFLLSDKKTNSNCVWEEYLNKANFIMQMNCRCCISAFSEIVSKFFSKAFSLSRCVYITHYI